LFLIKTYGTTRTYNDLKVFCTEKLTGECGSVREFRTNFEKTELINEFAEFSGESVEERVELIKLLFVL